MPKNAANSHHDWNFFPPRLIRLRLCVRVQRLEKKSSFGCFFYFLLSRSAGEGATPND
jgi:hypothetical protein